MERSLSPVVEEKPWDALKFFSKHPGFENRPSLLDVNVGVYCVLLSPSSTPVPPPRKAWTFNTVPILLAEEKFDVICPMPASRRFHVECPSLDKAHELIRWVNKDPVGYWAMLCADPEGCGVTHTKNPHLMIADITLCPDASPQLKRIQAKAELDPAKPKESASYAAVLAPRKSDLATYLSSVEAAGFVKESLKKILGSKIFGQDGNQSLAPLDFISVIAGNNFGFSFNSVWFIPNSPEDVAKIMELQASAPERLCQNGFQSIHIRPGNPRLLPQLRRFVECRHCKSNDHTSKACVVQDRSIKICFLRAATVACANAIVARLETEGFKDIKIQMGSFNTIGQRASRIVYLICVDVPTAKRVLEVLCSKLLQPKEICQVGIVSYNPASCSVCGLLHLRSRFCPDVSIASSLEAINVVREADSLLQRHGIDTSSVDGFHQVHHRNRDRSRYRRDLNTPIVPLLPQANRFALLDAESGAVMSPSDVVPPPIPEEKRAVVQVNQEPSPANNQLSSVPSRAPLSAFSSASSLSTRALPPLLVPSSSDAPLSVSPPSPSASPSFSASFPIPPSTSSSSATLSSLATSSSPVSAPSASPSSTFPSSSSLPLGDTHGGAMSPSNRSPPPTLSLPSSDVLAPSTLSLPAAPPFSASPLALSLSAPMQTELPAPSPPPNLGVSHSPPRTRRVGKPAAVPDLSTGNSRGTSKPAVKSRKKSGDLE